MKKRLLAILLTLAMIMSLVPNIVIAAEDDAANTWQVVDGKYEGNAAVNKTVSNDDVRIQKNVIPTDVENEFQVYMGIDAKCMETITSTKITEILNDETQLQSLYTAGSANGFPDAYPGQEHTGNGSLAPDLKGSAKSCEPGDIRFKLIITYEKDGHTYLIAQPILSLGVPNSVLYLKVGEDFICLENIRQNGHRITIGGQTPAQDDDGNYIVPVHLTTMAFNALLTSHTSEETTTTSTLIVGDDGTAGISDPIGDSTNSYIVYDGFVSGDIVEGTAPDPSTEPGGTVNWQIDPKDVVKPEDPDLITETIETTWETDAETGTTTEVTVITRSWWAENIVELTYDVHLAVDKAGFTSGTVYPVNGTTELNYGDGKSLEFPVPTVKGTLYDFSFKKVDEEGTALPGVTFTLSGPNDNPDVSAYSPSKTAVSGSDGTVSFTDLPWGSYTLTETIPEGYTGGSDQTLNIGYTDWPDNITHNDTANDIYAAEDDWQIVNKQNKVKVNKAVAVHGDLDESTIEHTIYYALKNKTDNSYLTDSSGNLIYQTITISGGVPSPASVTFKGVPSGEYNVMELASVDPIKELAVGDVVTESDGTKIKVQAIAATDADGSGNDANLINGNASAEVSFTNTYAHADVPVKFTANKKWATYSGKEVTPPQGATVTYTLYRTAGDTPDQVEEVTSITLDGTVDELTEEESGIKKGELKAWEATFDNLPNQDENDYAYTYKVKETVPEGYAAYSGNTAMGEDDYLTQNGGTITNRKQTTDVTIKKVVSGHNSADQEFSFTAALPSGTDFAEGQPDGVTVSGNQATFKLEHNEQVVLKDVPVGAELTVTEQEEENFSTSVQCGTETQSGTEYVYTVAEPGNPIVFTNTRKTGNLTVSKSVVSDLPADKTTDFDFTVKLNDNTISGTFGDVTFTNGEATFKLKDGQSKSITGLPAGVEYTVTEATATGFTTEKTGDEGTISTTASTAAFTNTRKVGDLAVSKTVVSPLDADKDLEFSFVIFVRPAISGTYTVEGEGVPTSITFSNGSANLKLKHGQTATIKGLPTTLNFEVHESVDSVAKDFIQAPLNEAGDPIITGTISTTPSTAAFTNTAKPGTLKVTKTFSGITEAQIPAGFVINAGTYELKIADADKGSKFPTYTWTKEVPAGSYTVTEDRDNAAVVGYSLSITGDNGTTKDLPKAGSVEFEITDTYTLDTGYLDLKKELSNDSEMVTIPDKTKFTISGTTLSGVEFEDLTVTYEELPMEKPFEVPLGTYSVTEDQESAAVEGFTLEETTYSDDVTLANKGDKGLLIVTNKYTLDTGMLKLTKEAVGLEGNDTVPDSAQFVISGTPIGEGVTFDDVTVTYAEIKDGQYSIEVPTGEYTVKESGAEVKGYTLETTYSGKAEVEKDSSAELKVTNTYTLDKGTLTLIKTATGLEGKSKVPDSTKFVISGTPVAAGATFEDVTITYADMKSGKYSLEVPAGEYTVKESGADITGYTLKTTYSDKAEVEKDGSAELTVTNEYSLDKGTLKLTKTATGLEGNAAVPDNAQFVISGTPSVAEVTFKDVKVTYADIKDGKYSIEVPAGEYTVKESRADVAGYKLKTTYSGNAKVVKGEAAELKVTNTYTKEAPLTGDSSGLGFWTWMTIISGILLLLAAAIRMLAGRRSRKER